MVAVLSDNYTSAYIHPGALQRRTGTAWGPAGAAHLRPSLRPAPAGLRVRRDPDPAVFRRRRLLAAGLLLLLVAIVLVTARSMLAGAGGGPLATTGAAASAGPVPAAATSWVVRPGDTLWSIARALQPSGDVRPLVDRLSGEVGGSGLFPGERIAVPASLAR